jgi:hypothetical protein
MDQGLATPVGGTGQGQAAPRLVHPLTSSFRLFIPSIEKTLRAQTLFQKTYFKPPPSSTRDREGPEALPGTLLETRMMVRSRHPVGNPKRKVWWAQQQVSLSCETKVHRISRRKNHTSEGWCPLALRHSGQWRQINTCWCETFHQQQCETCTQHNQVFAPTYDEVVNFTGLL